PPRTTGRWCEAARPDVRSSQLLLPLRHLPLEDRLEAFERPGALQGRGEGDDDDVHRLLVHVVPGLVLVAATGSVSCGEDRLLELPDLLPGLEGQLLSRLALLGVGDEVDVAEDLVEGHFSLSS